MVKRNKCSCCNYIYEVVWDDSIDDYYDDVENNSEYEDNNYSYENDELYAEYCPFCGTHQNYVN